MRITKISNVNNYWCVLLVMMVLIYIEYEFRSYSFDLYLVIKLLVYLTLETTAEFWTKTNILAGYLVTFDYILIIDLTSYKLQIHIYAYQYQ